MNKPLPDGRGSMMIKGLMRSPRLDKHRRTSARRSGMAVIIDNSVKDVRTGTKAAANIRKRQNLFTCTHILTNGPRFVKLTA